MSIIAPLKNLENKRVALLGLGLENQSLLRLFSREKVQMTITICDRRDQKTLTALVRNLQLTKPLQISYRSEADFNRRLFDFDILFRSPGWPLACPGIQEAKKKKPELTITSPMNLFFALAPRERIIGVSGTKGKGTTASLIAAALKAGGQKVFIGGNIGIAPLDFLDNFKKGGWAVIELSSFQLEDLKFSPKIAVLTNLFKEHLAPADPLNPNYHKSLSAYWQAKLQLAKNQKKGDYLIVNNSLKNKLKNFSSPAKLIFYQESLLPLKLAGSYNRANAAAAETVAKVLRIEKSKADSGIKNFKGLEHRLEKIATKKGVTYFDNSFSTTPESSCLDLESFSQPIILIAGGADKAANFLPFAKLIKKKVKYLILLSGTGTEKIKEALKKNKFNFINSQEVNSMKKAVMLAAQKAATGDVVLLSTACASFGLFKNYKERGNLFSEAVKKI